MHLKWGEQNRIRDSYFAKPVIPDPIRNTSLLFAWEGSLCMAERQPGTRVSRMDGHRTFYVYFMSCSTNKLYLSCMTFCRFRKTWVEQVCVLKKKFFPAFFLGPGQDTSNESTYVDIQKRSIGFRSDFFSFFISCRLSHTNHLLGWHSGIK